MKHHYIIHTMRCLVAAALTACWLPAAFSSEQDDMIVTLQLSGQLRLDCKAGKAWLDPELWVALDAAAKENFARTVFENCHSAQGAKNITIYDAQSGTQLATFSPKEG